MPLVLRLFRAFFCKATLPGWALLLSCTGLPFLLPSATATLGQYLVLSLACYGVLLAVSIALRAGGQAPLPLRLEARPWRTARRRRATVLRLAYKTAGMATTLLGAAVGAAALVAWQFEWYAGLAQALPTGVLPALCAAGWLVMCVADGFDRAPWDSYYRIGRWMFAARRPLPQAARAQLQFSVLRGFFLCYGVSVLSYYLEIQPPGGGDRPLFDALLQTTDLAKITLGIGSFVVVSRLLDNHPRSVDTNPVAWLATLACYPPLGIWQSVFTELGAGSGSAPLTGQLQWLQQAALAVLLLVYASDTLAWGDRFSQLSYRGLVSSGPFAFMRHPAYTSKCLILALTTLPAANASNAWASCGFVALLCALYALRGYTEGRHLRRYPEYLALHPCKKGPL